jgi:hypothetical protein
VDLGSDYVLDSIDVYSKHLCSITYYNVIGKMREKFKCLVLIYDNLCEDIEIRMEAIQEGEVVDLIGKWCVLYRIDGRDRLLFFKDRRNVLEIREYDRIEDIFQRLKFYEIISRLDFAPCYFLMRDYDVMRNNCFLYDVTCDVGDRLRCWKISSLMLKDKLTGVVKVYLADEKFEKTKEFVNIRLIMDVYTNPQNTFQLCSSDAYANCEEDVRFDCDWG